MAAGARRGDDCRRDGRRLEIRTAPCTACSPRWPLTVGTRTAGAPNGVEADLSAPASASAATTTTAAVACWPRAGLSQFPPAALSHVGASQGARSHEWPSVPLGVGIDGKDKAKKSIQLSAKSLWCRS